MMNLLKRIGDTLIPVAAVLIFMLVFQAKGWASGCINSFGSGKHESIIAENDRFHDTTLAGKLVDSAAFRKKVLQLANGDKTGKWPPATAYPLQGAIVPFNRVVAFYGNFLCPQMGILGELPRAQVLARLTKQALEWKNADSSTPVLPAIHYIAVTAQGTPCGGKYRLRMSEKEVMKAVTLADSIKGIVFLDVQVGLSDLKAELPLLEKYLSMPAVHLGVDPEFSMKSGKRPGTAIGTIDASDINFAMDFLSRLVRERKIPPKILVVHRFTEKMLTNYKDIITRPEVQVVVNMDGFGAPALKKNSYNQFIYRQPVQFTGFKIFYKNDVKTGGRIMSPQEILALKPRPSYIQYQ